MRAERFIDLAEMLLECDGAEAAALRSAVSRAYYAVFHVTKGLQESLGAERVNSHTAIGERFQNSPEPTISNLGERYLSLMTRRLHADYYLGGRHAVDIENPETVRGLVDEARALASEMATVASGELRAAAEAAVHEDDNRRFRRK